MSAVGVRKEGGDELIFIVWRILLGDISPLFMYARSTNCLTNLSGGAPTNCPTNLVGVHDELSDDFETGHHPRGHAGGPLTAGGCGAQ